MSCIECRKKQARKKELSPPLQTHLAFELVDDQCTVQI